MCMHVSGAIENKDALCCSIFSEAGQVIAEHILALAPKINKVRLVKQWME